MKYEDATIQILYNSGWFEGRKIDLKPIQTALTLEGFFWNFAVEEFLQEFGNLHISFVDKDLSVEQFHFDPLDALKGVHKSWILDEYSSIVQKKMCVIGQSHRGYLVLSMAEDGSVYGGYDDFLCLIGQNGKDSIQNIINQIDFVILNE